jgi:hypothetical protein
VGEPTHFHNVEFLVVSGDRADVERCVAATRKLMPRAAARV